MQSHTSSNTNLFDTHKFEIKLLPGTSAISDCHSSPDQSAADKINNDGSWQRNRQELAVETGTISITLNL
jgi:hypothetical protein